MLVDWRLARIADNVTGPLYRHLNVTSDVTEQRFTLTEDVVRKWDVYSISHIGDLKNLAAFFLAHVTQAVLRHLNGVLF